MEPAGDCDHRCVVGRELEFRKECGPSSLASFLFDTGAETAVCGYAAADCNLLDTSLFRCLNELVHQYVDERLLEACADVGLVLFHELGIDCHLVADEVKERGLDAAEAIVETLDLRLRKLVLKRVAFLCESVNDRTARIAESHHLRTLVKCLTYSIIDCLSEDLVFERAVDADDLRVSAGNKQAEVWEFRLAVFLAMLLDEVCKYMTLKVVDLDKGFVKGHRKSLCE